MRYDDGCLKNPPKNGKNKGSNLETDLLFFYYVDLSCLQMKTLHKIFIYGAVCRFHTVQLQYKYVNKVSLHINRRKTKVSWAQVRMCMEDQRDQGKKNKPMFIHAHENSNLI